MKIECMCDILMLRGVHHIENDMKGGVPMQSVTFGSFLRAKRLERGFTLRGFAGKMELSPVYICDIEKNRKPAPTAARMEEITRLLDLDKHEKEIMYDLAALSQCRPSVSGDLPEYIMNHEVVRVALRTANEADATDEEWQDFIEKLNQRMKKKHDPIDRETDS